MFKRTFTFKRLNDGIPIAGCMSTTMFSSYFITATPNVQGAPKKILKVFYVGATTS